MSSCRAANANGLRKKAKKMTEEQLAWIDSLPEPSKSVAKRWPPGKQFLYTLKTTGQRCHIVAYSDDRTVRVFVPTDQNPDRLFSAMMFGPNGGHSVFGINPDDLELVSS